MENTSFISVLPGKILQIQYFQKKNQAQEQSFNTLSLLTDINYRCLLVSDLKPRFQLVLKQEINFHLDTQSYLEENELLFFFRAKISSNNIAQKFLYFLDNG